MAAEQALPSGVPDALGPEFALECQCQSLLVAQADAADLGLQHFRDEALADSLG